MSDLRNRAKPKPFCQNELIIDETMISNEDSEEEDYHSIINVSHFDAFLSSKFRNFDMYY